MLLLAAVAFSCDDDDDDVGMQPPPPTQQPVNDVGLELIAENFTSPVLLLEPPDDSGRLFIVDQTGFIRIRSAGGEILETPFLDIRDQLVDLMEDFDERGLLGLAFHPDFANNGRFFIYYSAPLREEAPEGWDHTSRISEFTVSSTSADFADIGSERILLEVDQPQFNHDGGMIAFGPDNFLYIALGDGGAANDVGLGHPPLGNGQDITTLLGSILRIDVDGPQPYGIPTDNPFAGSAQGREEIYAYGFRNPYRFSFDPEGDRDLFVGDAGQNRVEEVSIVELGENYGWNIREGTSCFDPDMPDDPPASCPEVGARGEPLVPPILEYPNANVEGGLGLAVIGGFVYRGSAVPELEGEYIFGDYSESFEEPLGSVFAARQQLDGTWEMRELSIAGRSGGGLGSFVRGFGQDRSGEVYLLTADNGGPTGNTGRVYRIVAAGDAQPAGDAGVADGGMDAGVEDGDAGVDGGVSEAFAMQVERGSTLYASNCARCHGGDARGTALAPPLAGPGALPLDPPPERDLRETQFRTALDVFEFASQFMPLDNPGALSDQEYLDIIAFALSANAIQLDEPLTLQNAGEVVINPRPE